MTPEKALAKLEALSDPERAEGMAAYHKSPRRYLGVAVPDIDRLAKGWRTDVSMAERAELADGLWATDIHEARVAAAKLLTQARLKPDDTPVWDVICGWVPTFDAWAVADHACAAGARRLVADPSRLDTVENWTRSDHLWTKRAALVMTLPWTKQNHSKPEELEARDRVLGWAASYVEDRQWFIQKAIAWWLRELSKHDPQRTRAFLDRHGEAMKPFARREAGKYLT